MVYLDWTVITGVGGIHKGVEGSLDESITRACYHWIYKYAQHFRLSSVDHNCIALDARQMHSIMTTHYDDEYKNCW